jgi:hypothetical protein
MAPMIDHYVVQGHIKQRIKYARALNHAWRFENNNFCPWYMSCL